MKITKKRIRQLIKETIYGSRHYKAPPVDPSLYVTPQVKNKLSSTISSESEAERRQGYQLASALQQDETVFPNDGGAPYSETPYKGLDYVDDINDYNNRNILNIIGVIGNYLTSKDIDILRSIMGKDLNYFIAGKKGLPTFFLARDKRASPHAIETNVYESMIAKIAKEKKNVTQTDFSEVYNYVDGRLVEAIDKLSIAIMKIANKTYVSKHDVDSLGIGYLDRENYIEFYDSEYEILFNMGKLVIL